MKRSVTSVQVLLRIERHLRRLLREKRSGNGSALTIRDAARKANLSETTIRRAIRSKNDHLPATDVSLGRGKPNWRIDPNDFEAWLKRRVGTLPPTKPESVRSTGKSRYFPSIGEGAVS
jgi:hypothetical protein